MLGHFFGLKLSRQLSISIHVLYRKLLHVHSIHFSTILDSLSCPYSLLHLILSRPSLDSSNLGLDLSFVRLIIHSDEAFQVVIVIQLLTKGSSYAWTICILFRHNPCTLWKLATIKHGFNGQVLVSTHLLVYLVNHSWV